MTTNQPFRPSPLLTKLPLRVIFILSTLLQVVTAVGLAGYFSYRNGQGAVNEVATQLRNEVTARVRDRLLLYVETPHLINQLNANELQFDTLETDPPEQQEKYFWHQIRTFPVITYNFYGSSTGRYLGARRTQKGELEVIQRDMATGENRYYATDKQGDRTQLIQVVPNFDARQRPWYQKAVQRHQSTWSDIYPDFSTKALAITAVKPVYDRRGKLRGVLGSDFIFSQVNEFLQQLKIGKTGKIFIMERSGLLVATSTADLTHEIRDNATHRILARDSSNRLIQESVVHLQDKFGSLKQIPYAYQSDFDFQGARQFLQVTPLRDWRGLDWLIVVVVPEADFMGRIRDNNRFTILLCGLSLIIATIVGLQTSRWIVKPIQRLNQAAKQLTHGHWSQQLPIHRGDEIGQLANSFSSMTEQLKASFETLEQKVRDRTEGLAQANRELENKNALIRQVFGRYLSNEVVTNLLETPNGLALGGERRKITILTSDLRGFTATAERLQPEQVITILNFYLEYMADVITRYEGTIDEFMGDGILALFGAPTMRSDDTERAIACAIAMQQAMVPVNAQMHTWGLAPIEMGIGVHTGEVVVGNLGSEKRTKYGVVGNHVNLTYRIESCTIGGQIFVSEDVMREVGDLVHVISTQQVQMKGVPYPIKLFEVGGLSGIHQLYLVQSSDVLLPLPAPISVQAVELESKHIGDRVEQAHIIQLSHREAILKYANPDSVMPDPLTNLKLQLDQPEPSPELEDDFYAKVLDKPADPSCFRIHFTALSPTLRTYFDNLYNLALKFKT